MQAAAVAAMAAQRTLTASSSHRTLLASLPNPKPPVLQSSFRGLSRKLLRSSLSVAAASTKKPLVVVAVTKKAVVVLKGDSSVEGVVTLSQEDDGTTIVSVRITGLTPGKHAFHLHEYGDTTNGYISTGSPPKKKMAHGAPEDEIGHVGYTGNIVANVVGVAEAMIVERQIPLTGPNAIIGRAFVVELEGDLEKGGHELSLTTGNAVGRLACGVVGSTPV